MYLFVLYCFYEKAIECAFILTKFCKENEAYLPQKTYSKWLEYTLQEAKSYRNLFEKNYQNLSLEQKLQIDNRLRTLRKDIIDFSFKNKNYLLMQKAFRYLKIRKNIIK